MPLTVRFDGSFVGGQPNNATASWWNDFHALLTGGMTDQPVTLGNTLTIVGNTWLTPQTAFGAGFPALTVGIGDNDTGINWIGDGHLQVVVNNGAWLDVQSGKSLGFTVLDSGTARLVHIYIGTTAPASPVEGDIWIKG